MILPDANWTVKQNCFIDEQATVRLNAGTNGNLTIDKDLRLGRPSADQAGRLQFPALQPTSAPLPLGAIYCSAAKRLQVEAMGW